MNCPVCDAEMEHFSYKEDSPYGSMVVEEGHACPSNHYKKFWSYGTDFVVIDGVCYDPNNSRKIREAIKRAKRDLSKATERVG